MSNCLPSLYNKKVSVASITDIVRSNNSTCPRPRRQQHYHDKNESAEQQKEKVSREVATLYELFSSVSTLPGYYSSSQIDSNHHVMCFCCQRQIIKNQKKNMSNALLLDTIEEDEEEEVRKRKIEEITSNITSALYYGSLQVRKYMKKVMTKENWDNIVKTGFPCPYQQPQETKSDNRDHYFCTLCNPNHQHTTLRLTLTPQSCRAQDNEIYGEYQNLLMPNKRFRRKQEIDFE